MIRSFQWDLARQVERLDWLIAQLPRYASWGYNEVHLHLEDAVEYPSLRGVARRDAYTHRQFGRLVDAATRAGINVVPIVNLLGHTQYLIKVPELRDLNELRADDGSPLAHGQICPLHPRTLEVAEKLLRDVRPFCTAGKVHVGLDESFHLGQHPLSKKEIARVGRAAHFARYVKRLDALTHSLDLRLGLWADMLYYIPEAIPLLPKGVTAYEWYYHAFKRWPRVELFNFAEMDIATPLRARGLALYGCPMNGAFRYEPLPHFGDRIGNIVSWWRHATRIKAEGFLVSSWEPYRLAIELTTAVDAAAAALWLEPEVTDPREMLVRGFERVFGRKGRTAARIAFAGDRFPFAGYPRWEINESWDRVSPRESPAEYRREERHFAKLVRKCAQQKVPEALRASVEFRHYLAARDLFVRNGGSRPRLKVALRAAQAMWRRTRDPKVCGPNEALIFADAARLKGWEKCHVIRDTSKIAKRGFCGWRLCYKVRNFAPALQFVGVEQRRQDGSWKLLQSCPTIEFQTRAARPRGSFVREHAAPVAWDGDAARPPRLRIVLRGIGAVKIGAIALISPEAKLVPSGAGRWIRLGRAAPRHGWPDADWQKLRDAYELRFGPIR
ncbi:MAG TPA: family 20 glycosylhydrolase [Opitutus sp.]|nr:family 20 glycosylhydrolase [Opitutus sp.]